MINLAATDTLQGNAQTNATVTVTVSGMELVGTTETYKKLYQGQPTTSVASLYSPAASTTGFVRSIHVVNTAASTQTFALYVSGTAGTNRITPDITLAANGFAVYSNDAWKLYNSNGNLLTTVPLATATPVVVDTTAGAAGTAALASASDHRHQLSVATPVAATSAALSSAGVATTVPRSDHLHQAAGGTAAIVATPATFGAVETVIDKFQFPANLFLVGTTIRVTAFGTISATVAGTIQARIRLGTAGTTSDVQVCTVGPLGSATAAVGWHIQGIFTVRTTGSGGTALGNLFLSVGGSSGSAGQTATVAVNTTVANFADITLIGGGTTPVVTVINTLIEAVKL